MGQHGISAYESDYGADVTLKIRFRSELADGLQKELVEATSGRIQWEKIGEGYFVF